VGKKTPRSFTASDKEYNDLKEMADKEGRTVSNMILQLMFRAKVAKND